MVGAASRIEGVGITAASCLVGATLPGGRAPRAADWEQSGSNS